MAVQVFVLGLYLPPVFPSPFTSPPQTIISLLVQTAVCAVRPGGAFVVVVAIQLSLAGLYLPPVMKMLLPAFPPQMIISLPVQTAVWLSRADGALLVLVTAQLSVAGLYLPPVFKFPPE